MSQEIAVIIVVTLSSILVGIGVYNHLQDLKHLRFRKSRRDLNPEFWED